MICNNCAKDMAECTCPDCAERIHRVLTMPYVYIGPDYKKRLEQHAKEVENQQSTVE